MKLYLAAGQYVGTQADARKLDKAFTPVEVPTAKDGLIAYLNAHRLAVFNEKGSSDSVVLEIKAEPRSTAGDTLDRMDRQAAKNALEAALASVKHGLSMLERKYSGEPAPITLGSPEGNELLEGLPWEEAEDEVDPFS